DFARGASKASLPRSGGTILSHEHKSLLLNAGTIAERANSPPWIRRGGCAIKKISRSLISSRRRGGWFKPPIIGSLNQPPRPLPQRRLRDIFLRSRPPLLIQGGEYLLLYSLPHVEQ